MRSIKQFAKSQKSQRRIIIAAFILIPLILLFVFTYLPFGEMVSFSFFDMKYIGRRNFVAFRITPMYSPEKIFLALSN